MKCLQQVEEKWKGLCVRPHLGFKSIQSCVGAAFLRDLASARLVAMITNTMEFKLKQAFVGWC